MIICQQSRLCSAVQFYWQTTRDNLPRERRTAASLWQAAMTTSWSTPVIRHIIVKILLLANYMDTLQGVFLVWWARRKFFLDNLFFRFLLFLLFSQLLPGSQIVSTVLQHRSQRRQHIGHQLVTWQTYSTEESNLKKRWLKLKFKATFISCNTCMAAISPAYFLSNIGIGSHPRDVSMSPYSMRYYNISQPNCVCTTL